MIDYSEFLTDIRPGFTIYLATPEGVDECIFAGMGPHILGGEVARSRVFLASANRTKDALLVTLYSDDENLFDDYLAASARVAVLASEKAIRYKKVAVHARHTDTTMLPSVSE